MRRRSEERERHWRGVLSRQCSSGLSVAAFCRRESISPPSFYAWRRKLHERNATAQRDATAESNAIVPRAQLIPVRIEPTSAAAAVQILLPGGVRVDVPEGAAQATVADVLKALTEAAAC